MKYYSNYNMPNLTNNKLLYEELYSKLKPVDGVKLNINIQRTGRDIIKTAFKDFAVLYYDDGYNEDVFESFYENILFVKYERPADIENVRMIGFPKDITNIIHKMSSKMYYLFFISHKSGFGLLEYFGENDDHCDFDNPKFLGLYNELYLIKLMHRMEYYESISDLIATYNTVLETIAYFDDRFVRTCNNKVSKFLELGDNDNLLYQN